MCATVGQRVIDIPPSMTTAERVKWIAARVTELGITWGCPSCFMSPGQADTQIPALRSPGEVGPYPGLHTWRSSRRAIACMPAIADSHDPLGHEGLGDAAAHG